MATLVNSKIDWLYPELLSKEGLIEILSQRFVQLPDDTQSTSRDDLLDLYYQYVIPRSQRKYRLNRRGRDMSKKQIVQSKKRKITGPDFTAPPTKKIAPEPSSRLLTSFDASPTGDRLKPPPSCINFENKVVKLGGSRASSDSLSSSVPLSSENRSSESMVSSSPKVIKLNRTSSGDAKSPTRAPETVTFNKTVKLINSHLSGSGDSAKKSHNGNKDEEPMEVDNPEASTEKKKKINKISWP